MTIPPQLPFNITVEDTAGSDWDAFVGGKSESSLYHLAGWTEIARDVFGHRALFVEAREPSGLLVGVLPVVEQRSLLFGKFATSVAFFNYGGALGKDAVVAREMMVRASETAKERGCCYLEFRDTQPREGCWTIRTDKAALQLDLPPDIGTLSKRLGSKLRSQVKRAEREEVKRRIGALELLDDFYTVFAENMRDLGTPVYPRRFFEAILKRYEEQCQVVVIDWRGRPSAAAFLVFWRDRAEVPWAACRAPAKPFGLNMKLYWELLSLAVQRGCKLFDFGRSTIDSGTYRFKQQWGAQPVPLFWYRWERHGDKVRASRADERGIAMQLGTAIWQRTPLGIANFLGPLISGALPW